MTNGFFYGLMPLILAPRPVKSLLSPLRSARHVNVIKLTSMLNQTTTLASIRINSIYPLSALF